MIMRNSIRFTLGLLLVTAIVFQASAKQETVISEGPESVVYDTDTGDYFFTYTDIDSPAPPGGRVVTYKSTYVPHTKIDPVVKSYFKFNIVDDVVYRYTIKNNRKARQNVSSFGVLVTSLKGTTFSTNTPALLKSHYDDMANLPAGEHARRVAESLAAAHDDARKANASTPPGWSGRIGPAVSRTGLVVRWNPEPFEEELSLAPGKHIDGFGYTSQDLPGIGTAVLRGYAPVFGWKNRGGPTNDTVRWVANDIMKKSQSLDRYVAVPTFTVPNPFNAATLLERLQKHAKVDLVRFRLIDSAFASQLDPAFIAAIDAARRSDINGARYQIKELRRALKQEHHDADKEHESDEIEDDDLPISPARIDKLAARVLDFNLKYVDQRLKP